MIGKDKSKKNSNSDYLVILLIILLVIGGLVILILDRDVSHYITMSIIVLLGLISSITLIINKNKYNELSTIKNQFLASISHEIRTSMNAIIGFCRMTKKTDDPVKKDKLLDDIIVSSDHLLELINAILDMSKIESKKMTLDLEHVSLQNMIRNIEMTLSSQLMKKNQKFNINISPNIPSNINCDRSRLTRTLINIISNAIKFTPENGEISINIDLIKKEGNLCNIGFIIKDNGIGIDEANLAKLFDPFQSSTDSINGGTGIGLTLAKLFIEMMRGSISVTSKVGVGSTFKFNIMADLVVENTNIVSSFTRDETIDCIGMIFLVAEDSPVNQVIARDVLESFGAMVDFVNDGEECFEKFTSSPDKYRIIFMDIQMPVLNGLEATKKIRACGLRNAGTIPIIAMTAEVFQEDIDKALNAGMNAHLGKPLNIKDLERVIKEHMKK